MMSRALLMRAMLPTSSLPSSAEWVRPSPAFMDTINFSALLSIQRVMGKPRYSPRATRSSGPVICLQAAMMAVPASLRSV